MRAWEPTAHAWESAVCVRVLGAPERRERTERGDGVELIKAAVAWCSWGTNEAPDNFVLYDYITKHASEFTVLEGDRWFDKCRMPGDAGCSCSRCAGPIAKDRVMLRCYWWKGGSGVVQYHPECLGLPSVRVSMHIPGVRLAVGGHEVVGEEEKDGTNIEDGERPVVAAGASHGGRDAAGA